mmetsp:Transcript_4179/g.12555  ORF Transcript_4179/g.12555 Transcript_4179/m.12555 type:complete len:384 (+) Transcript_4179:234-1385(+)
MLREDDATAPLRVPQTAGCLEGLGKGSESQPLRQAKGRGDQGELRVGLASSPAVVRKAPIRPPQVQIDHDRRAMLVEDEVDAPLAHEPEVRAQLDAGGAHGVRQQRVDLRGRRDVAHVESAARREQLVCDDGHAAAHHVDGGRRLAGRTHHLFQDGVLQTGRVGRRPHDEAAHARALRLQRSLRLLRRHLAGENVHVRLGGIQDDTSAARARGGLEDEPDPGVLGDEALPSVLQLLRRLAAEAARATGGAECGVRERGPRGLRQAAVQEALCLLERADDGMGVEVAEAAQAVPRREGGDARVGVHAVEHVAARRRRHRNARDGRRGGAVAAPAHAIRFECVRDGGEHRVGRRVGRSGRARVEPDDAVRAQPVGAVVGGAPVLH